VTLKPVLAVIAWYEFRLIINYLKLGSVAREKKENNYIRSNNL
jgi:hypothetical protein